MAVWLDIGDLVKYLKLPKSTIYKLTRSRALPGHKVGRAWRFDRDEVDQWIKNSKRSATAGEAKGSGRTFKARRSA